MAYNRRRHQQRDAESADLVNFIKEEAILLTDPMFSRDALDSLIDKRQRSNNRRRGVKTYATKTDITDGNEKKDKAFVICVREIT